MPTILKNQFKFQNKFEVKLHFPNDVFLLMELYIYF